MKKSLIGVSIIILSLIFINPVHSFSILAFTLGDSESDSKTRITNLCKNVGDFYGIDTELHEDVRFKGLMKVVNNTNVYNFTTNTDYAIVCISDRRVIAQVNIHNNELTGAFLHKKAVLTMYKNKNMDDKRIVQNIMYDLEFQTEERNDIFGMFGPPNQPMVEFVHKGHGSNKISVTAHWFSSSQQIKVLFVLLAS